MLTQTFDYEAILEAAPDLKTGTEQAVQQWHEVYVPAVMETDIQPILGRMKAAKESYLSSTKELSETLREMASQLGYLPVLARRFGVGEVPLPVSIYDQSAFISQNEILHVDRHR
ncbi:hypothetical protein [Brevibacillus borstelensis]|uniref:hypothetical protein n=1 Tax=Brevibacillus borstelensis TaxID=45462 RepID=UPI00046806B3|nr:hypothetical protein [Brevibacillus borstelensis]MCC0566551.1 hypothetical protein [Brevibacillus borstelensis]MCM3473053.1 hypothetical protein [Brevibacillus borstelensis]MCM3561679.1 hypothetical protein [Brevibacillus borstelensis]MED1852981.1 hypothetical protein [Brevibacillus borstelensis]